MVVVVISVLRIQQVVEGWVVLAAVVLAVLLEQLMETRVYPLPLVMEETQATAVKVLVGQAVQALLILLSFLDNNGKTTVNYRT
jgi:hypothetical protein